jgi:tetratricopeptide (TPR) repeat protein
MTQRVGQLLSLFAPEVIPWQLVETLQAMSLQLNWTEADINQAKKQLYKRQLIERVEEREDCYKIHPLIREFLQVKLTVSEQADNFRRAFAWAMVEIAQEIPDAPTRKDIEAVKDAIPHLEEVATNLTDALRDEDLLWLFDRLGRFYKSQGLYALAEPWFLQCLSLAKARFGHDHPDVAATLNNLAGLYDAQGRYSEAEILYLQALKVRRRLLGDNHPDVANSLNNLALLYYSQERYSEAEPLYLQALELRQCLLGNDHPDVATSLNNLALLYYSQGDYTKAEQLLVQALKLSERVLGVNHPNPTIFRENLANFRAKMGAKNFWLSQMLTEKFLKFMQGRKN